MKNLALVTFVICALCELIRYAQELAGPPRGGPPKDEEEPRTVADFRAEFRGRRLPSSVYKVFRRGVNYQINGQDQEALREYGKLRKVPRAGGRFVNLVRYSKSLRHNIRLIIGKHHRGSSNK